MKKIYTRPEIDILNINSDSIISLSSGDIQSGSSIVSIDVNAIDF